MPFDDDVSTLATEVRSLRMSGISATGISIAMANRLPLRSTSSPSRSPAVPESARKPPARATNPRMNDSSDSAASSLVN